MGMGCFRRGVRRPAVLPREVPAHLQQRDGRGRIGLREDPYGTDRSSGQLGLRDERTCKLSQMSKIFCVVKEDHSLVSSFFWGVLYLPNKLALLELARVGWRHRGGGQRPTLV